MGENITAVDDDRALIFIDTTFVLSPALTAADAGQPTIRPYIVVDTSVAVKILRETRRQPAHGVLAGALGVDGEGIALLHIDAPLRLEVAAVRQYQIDRAVGVQAGRDGHIALHHIPAGGQIVPLVVKVKNAVCGIARQHGVFVADLHLAVRIQIGDRIGGDRHFLHPLRHQLQILGHRITEIPLRHIVVFVVQIVFVIPADKGITFLDRVSGPLYLLPLLNSLGLYLAASIGIKGHRHICNGRRLICRKRSCRQ